MKTQTVDATEQGDGSAGSGDAPTTVELIGRLEKSVHEPLVDWATRASPLQVAARIRGLESDQESLVAENAELRAAVKSQVPLLALKTYRERGYFSLAVVSHAALLEERGDKCHVEFARDGNGQIYGIVLSVEDV